MKIQIELDSLDELSELIAIIRGQRAVDPAALQAATEELKHSTTDLKDAVDEAHANQPGE